MKYKSVIFIILIFCVNLAKANTEIKNLLDSANVYYSGSKFEKAINNYELIIGQDYEAAEIYYNLGNSYYKIHNVAKSILNYERALLLSPKDEDIIFNLELANTHIVDKLEEIPPFFMQVWISNFAKIVHANTWASISVISFILFLLLFIVYLFTLKVVIKKVSFWIGVLLITISISTFWLSSKNIKLNTKHNTAIVIAPSLTAKSTPDYSGTDLFVVHEGLKVNVDDKVGDWVEIKLSDGNKGWVTMESIEEI